MATNIPPHNLGEVIDAMLRADRRSGRSPLEELMQHRAGPGFPDRRPDPRPLRHPLRLRDRARLDHDARARRVRGDPRRPRSRSCVTEIPYQVEQDDAARDASPKLVRDKQIEGISDMRDESDRSGMRIVIELKRDATPEVVLNQLLPLHASCRSASASTCWRSTAAGRGSWGCATRCSASSRSARK